ncbi:MAG TPA: MBL fold metallo-hydrolase [Nitriliruptorales bacterium]|nr:MBL fold metallo-hydrolase [Nitriliruptorales bacterium]
MHVRFLGTGASGGTPGAGRSRRRESSALVTAGGTGLLLDATRDLPSQLADVDRIDAVALTHAHRDASGGVPALRRWLQERGLGPVPVLACPEALDVLRERYARLGHCALTPVDAGAPHEVGDVTLTACEVPHARQPRFRTYAWRVEGGPALVYASDTAEPTDDLRRLTHGAALLVADGATYGRRIFSHLRIDVDLPRLCGWEVDRILLTQIGRSAPSHDELVREVTRRCERAAPAHDGLEVSLTR